MRSLVIFDLDGTLLNTIADLGAAANHTMAVMGYPQHSPLSYPAMVGNGVAMLIERALPDEARTPEIRERALEIFRQYYDEHLADNTVPYPGIALLLDVAYASSTNSRHAGCGWPWRRTNTRAQ